MSLQGVMETLVNQSVDGMLVIDADGVVRFANPAARALFGRSVDELIGFQLGSPAIDAPVEIAVPGPDRSRTIEMRACEIAWEGGTACLATLRDVTEHRLLEEQLRQSHKMEAVGKLAGGIAHDFNNLLTAIISFAGFVRDDTLEGDPRREDIREVLRAADRASSLTRQLLAFSRRQPIAPRNVDLNALLGDADRLLRRTLGEDIEIVMVPGAGVWPVYIDPGQFEQVVLNLAINARDAMPTGGTLHLETFNDDQDVVLCVRDTGVGMTAEVRAHIFEPFFTTKESGKGTGLGLAMVYGLVTQAGGRIAVDSEVGRGTCIQLRLPRSERASREPSPPALLGGLAGSETVLVVEDEPMVRQAAVRILQKYGYAVLQASTGVEAIELFRRDGHRVDLVLCDVVMPHMNGRDTAASLTARRPELKVLFMTGYTDDAVTRHGVVDPGVQMLTKPFTEQGLVTRVRQLLDA